MLGRRATLRRITPQCCVGLSGNSPERMLDRPGLQAGIEREGCRRPDLANDLAGGEPCCRALTTCCRTLSRQYGGPCRSVLPTRPVAPFRTWPKAVRSAETTFQSAVPRFKLEPDRQLAIGGGEHPSIFRLVSSPVGNPHFGTKLNC